MWAPQPACKASTDEIYKIIIKKENELQTELEKSTQTCCHSLFYVCHKRRWQCIKVNITCKYRGTFCNNMQNRHSDNVTKECTTVVLKCAAIIWWPGPANSVPDETFRLAVNWAVSLHMYTPFSGHRTKHKGQRAGVRGHGIPRVPWVSSQNL